VIRIKVDIIGAGIGGLTAGALLTKQGYQVTIFEKEPYLGGRSLSFNGSDISVEDYKKLLTRFRMNVAFSEPNIDTIFEKNMLDGYKLDLGYHTIGGAGSNVNSVFAELDDNVDFVGSKVGQIKKDGFDFPFLSCVDKVKVFPKIFRLLFAGEKTMKRLDSVSMTETVKQYGRGKMKEILEVFSRSITTVNNLDEISTGEVFRAQKNLLSGSKPVGYPVGGMHSVTKKFADYITSNGSKIHLNTTVDKILIKDGKATGVVVGDKKYSSDFVVSNVLVQNFFSLADEKYFPKEYVKYIKSLNGTGSLCAYYSLGKIDSGLVGKTFHFIERNVGIDGDDAVGMIDFMTSSPDSNLSPSGSFLVQSYIICTPNEARDKKTLKTLRELLDKNLKVLIPGYKQDLNWAIYPTVWHLDGVAKTIDKDKPDIVSPVDNLYLVGDCVKAPGIGFNCALNSASILADMLKQK